MASTPTGVLSTGVWPLPSLLQVLASAPEAGSVSADAGGAPLGPLVTPAQFSAWHASEEHRVNAQRAGTSKHHAQALQERVNACSQLVEQVRGSHPGGVVSLSKSRSHSPYTNTGGPHPGPLPGAAGPTLGCGCVLLSRAALRAVAFCEFHSSFPVLPT